MQAVKWLLIVNSGALDQNAGGLVQVSTPRPASEWGGEVGEVLKHRR